MDNPPSIKETNGMTFESMRNQASILLKSGFLPSAIKTPEQALTIMMTGRELGLGVMESLRSINVVNGRPCMSAQLLLALCYKTKEVEQAYFERQTDVDCVFVLKRKGSPAYKAVWSLQRAAKLQLDKKDNWQKQSKNMLSWRAISEASRIVFPDAICGLYTEDEAEDIMDVPVMADPGSLMPRPKTETKAPAVELTPPAGTFEETRNAVVPDSGSVDVAENDNAPLTPPPSSDERPLPDGYVIIRAKRNNVCKSCKGEIVLGTEMAFSEKKGPHHPDCAS